MSYKILLLSGTLFLSFSMLPVFSTPIEEEWCSYSGHSDLGLTSALKYQYAPINVAVESIDSDIQKDGLSSEMIQRDTELKLRIAGLKVVDLKHIVGPHLYIRIKTNKMKSSPIYMYSTQIQFRDVVTYDRSSTKLGKKVLRLYGAPIWEKDGVVNAVRVEGISNIREEVKNLVDDFLNEYLKENPK